jgi:hypothetical protein
MSDKRGSIAKVTYFPEACIGSKAMIKKISDSHPNVFIENKQIKQVYECKTVGVTVDQHLSWKSNTENICKKITAGNSAIRRVKRFVDKETLIPITAVSIGCVW